MAVVSLDPKKHQLEFEVIKRSEVFGEPKEVFTLRMIVLILDAQRQVIGAEFETSKEFVQGHESRTAKFDSNMIDGFVKEVRKKYPDEDKYFLMPEFIHSHPHFEVVTKHQVVLDPLSDHDILVARELAQHFAFVMVSAVLPNGHKYTVAYGTKAGATSIQNLTEEFSIP